MEKLPKTQHPVPPPEQEDMVGGLSATTVRPPVLPRPPAGAVPVYGSRRITLSPPPSKVVAVKTEAEKDDRSGIVTGAKIIRLLMIKPMPPGILAGRLKMEESYIRRVCRVLADAGVILGELTPQRGTPPVQLYRLPPTPTRTGGQ